MTFARKTRGPLVLVAAVIAAAMLGVGSARSAADIYLVIAPIEGEYDYSGICDVGACGNVYRFAGSGPCLQGCIGFPSSADVTINVSGGEQALPAEPLHLQVGERHLLDCMVGRHHLDRHALRSLSRRQGLFAQRDDQRGRLRGRLDHRPRRLSSEPLRLRLVHGRVDAGSAEFWIERPMKTLSRKKKLALVGLALAGALTAGTALATIGDGGVINAGYKKDGVRCASSIPPADRATPKRVRSPGASRARKATRATPGRRGRPAR